jgi:hypothetical protein
MSGSAASERGAEHPTGRHSCRTRPHFAGHCRYPEVTESLSGTLEAWVEANADPVEAETDSQLDEAMREQLRDLGYVE